MLICGLIFGGGQVMYCKSLWKRIVPFFLAFGLGLIISSLFITKPPIQEELENNDIFEEKIISEKENLKLNLLAERKKCVPADSNLKYYRLNKFGNKLENTDEVQEKAKLEKQKNKEKLQKRIEERIEEIEKQLESIQTRNQTNLLYLEKCYDSDGRKQGKKTNRRNR